MSEYEYRAVADVIVRGVWSVIACEPRVSRGAAVADMARLLDEIDSQGRRYRRLRVQRRVIPEWQDEPGRAGAA